MSLALGLVVAGGLLSAYGQYRNLKAEEQSLKYRAELAQNNAILGNMEAAERRIQGNIEYTRHRLVVARHLSKQLTAFAASGVDVSSGTPAEVLADTAAIGETEAIDVRHNSLMDVWRLKNQARGLEAEGSLLTSTARNVRSSIPYVVGGSLLGAGGQALAVGGKSGSSKKPSGGKS